MPIIKIKNLFVTYFLGKSNEVRALSDANLAIEAGEFVIFFGASGCGKSTLLYTIAGLENPTQGEVVVNNTNLADMSVQKKENYRQKVVGMVFQAFYLIPSLTVEKNITIPKVAMGVGLKERTAEAEKLMKYFGVFEQRHKLPTELSGGQQQRVSICRALINDPDIILADEPVGNLDSKSASDVMSLIQQLNLKNKKTVILVTHDPSHLDIADRIFFMKDGRIIDTKVNAGNKRIILAPAVGEKSNLEMVSQTFTGNDTGVWGGLLLDYKAKEIVAEVLTGFDNEEISRLENIIKGILRNNTKDSDYLLEYLDIDSNHGGLDLDKRTALKLAHKLKDAAQEMKLVAELNSRQEEGQAKGVRQIRHYLLDAFNAPIKNSQTIDVIDAVIAERLSGLTDKKGVLSRLDAPLAEGGAGLHRKLAKKIAKHLELITPSAAQSVATIDDVANKNGQK